MLGAESCGRGSKSFLQVIDLSSGFRVGESRTVPVLVVRAGAEVVRVGELLDVSDVRSVAVTQERLLCSQANEVRDGRVGIGLAIGAPKSRLGSIELCVQSGVVST